TSRPGRGARTSSGRARRGRRRETPEPPSPARRSCHLPEHLVDALDEPLVAARLGGLRESRPYDEHVVVRGREGLVGQPEPPDLAQLPLDAVACHARPCCLGHGKPEPRLTRLLGAREPVQGEEPGRDRPAVPVDGVEVTGAGETVLALHALRREPLAALRAAALQDGASGPGGHPGPEAVLALPPADVWLIGALHRSKTGSGTVRSLAEGPVYADRSPCRLSTGPPVRKAV